MRVRLTAALLAGLTAGVCAAQNFAGDVPEPPSPPPSTAAPVVTATPPSPPLPAGPSAEAATPPPVPVQADSSWLLAQDRTRAPRPPRPPRPPRSSDPYSRGTALLDRRDWDDAVAAFNEAIESMHAKADGAYYWKAYALGKLGHREESLAQLHTLESKFPSSAWLNDAKALEIEMQQAAGRPVSPDRVDDEDLKLIAINGLMTSDPERAVPLLEKMVRGNQPPKVKERALFVLAQSGTPKAREIVVSVAKGGSNPDLQAKAIEYLGVFGGKENGQLLADIYKSTQDTSIRRRILNSYMVSGDREKVIQAARGETNPELRREAIRMLGVMGAQNEVLELARTEKDPALRREAIHSLGIMGAKAGDALVTLYGAETDRTAKRDIIHSLMIQRNSKALIALARKESDPELKREMVRSLAMMNDKDATDFLTELLK